MDTWTNGNVTTVAGRLTLMDNVSNRIISEINSLKKIAAEENAPKTEAAIDGLIVARQQRYDAMRKELEKLNQQGTITQPADTGVPMPETTVPPTTTRGRRTR